MNIKSIEGCVLNDLLPILDFSEGTPEFPLDFSPNQQHEVYINQELTHPDTDYIYVKMDQPVENADDLIAKREAFLLRVLDSVGNKELEYSPKSPKELTISNYKVIYDADEIVGGVPFKNDKYGSVCGMFIDCRKIGIEKLGAL